MNNQETVARLLARLYRELYGKMVSTIVSRFTIKNIGVAEDIVQDTFEAAVVHWQKEIPDNPASWLFRVCRNKMINQLERRSFAVADGNKILHETTESISDNLFDFGTIRDSQLDLLFACCHADLSPRSQLLFILKTVSGLRIAEIARALAMREEAVTKSLLRARKVLMENGGVLNPVHPAPERVAIVHIAIYLMFNEGYSTTQGNDPIRAELCMEAMRLTKALLDCTNVVNDDTYALMALMCFHTARASARTGLQGELIELEQQDRSHWDPELIAIGTKHFSRIARDKKATRFVLEAGIALTHCAARTFAETKWTVILGLYEKLRTINPSPFTELSYVMAIFYVRGAGAAISLLESSSYISWLRNYYLYYAALGKLYAAAGSLDLARENYEKALARAVQRAEREFLQAKLQLYQTSIES